jgi:hypothetical protein
MIYICFLATDLVLLGVVRVMLNKLDIYAF